MPPTVRHDGRTLFPNRRHLVFRQHQPGSRCGKAPNMHPSMMRIRMLVQNPFLSSGNALIAGNIMPVKYIRPRYRMGSKSGSNYGGPNSAQQRR